MRTKALLCAAALAAGALTSMAQVYSANVVGYVNVTLNGGGQYTFIANPLDASMGGTVANGNRIDNILTGAAVHTGDQVLRWNVGTFDIDTLVLTKTPTSWDTTPTLAPGEAFWYINNGATSTLTFVGQVQQGSVSWPGELGAAGPNVPGAGQYSALGSLVPLGGSVTNAPYGMNLAAHTGDQILTWSVADFDLSTLVITKTPTSWDHPEVNIDPGIGFLYINNGAAINWTFNFTVQ